jgi:hypothetical protein
MRRKDTRRLDARAFTASAQSNQTDITGSSASATTAPPPVGYAGATRPITWLERDAPR